MKLKVKKEKQSLISSLKDIYSAENNAVKTSVSIDINGCINLDSFKKLIDYCNNKIVIETQNKIVYIYGMELCILECSKHNAVCNGKIQKIELFDKEVDSEP